MGQPIFMFQTKNIDGVKVCLQRIREPVLKEYLREQGIFDDYVTTVEIDGVEYQVELKREQTLQFHYLARGDGPEDGQSVKDRKKEFKHWKVNRKSGQRSPASTARSKSINAVEERPFKNIAKNVLPFAGYFMYAWKGSKEEPMIQMERIAVLRQEAERFAKQDLVGVGAFTWGRQPGTGNPMPPCFSVAYPIIINDQEMVWLVVLAHVAIDPTRQDWPYANAVMSTADIPTIQPPTEAIPAETVAIEKLLTTIAQ